MTDKQIEQGMCTVTNGGEHDWYVNFQGRKGWTCKKCGKHLNEVQSPNMRWVDKDGK